MNFRLIYHKNRLVIQMTILYQLEKIGKRLHTSSDFIQRKQQLAILALIIHFFIAQQTVRNINFSI